jgi:hypothetical protein
LEVKLSSGRAYSEAAAAAAVAGGDSMAVEEGDAAGAADGDKMQAEESPAPAAVLGLLAVGSRADPRGPRIARGAMDLEDSYGTWQLHGPPRIFYGG